MTVVDDAIDVMERGKAEIERLRALNAELVTTLKYVVSAADLYELDRAKACARILLAKCEARP